MFVGQDGVAVILKGAFSENFAITWPEHQGASVAHIEPLGKALFYLSMSFASNQGFLFVVEGGGYLLLDGGVFPVQLPVRDISTQPTVPPSGSVLWECAFLTPGSDVGTCIISTGPLSVLSESKCHEVCYDVMSFGIVKYGASFVLRNMPQYSSSDLQPASQGANGTTNVAGLCPAYTTQTYWWKVPADESRVESSCKDDSDPCFSCSHKQAAKGEMRVWGTVQSSMQPLLLPKNPMGGQLRGLFEWHTASQHQFRHSAHISLLFVSV